jgi:hypothetical protein
VKVGVELVVEAEDGTDPASVASIVRRMLESQSPYRVLAADSFDVDAEAADFLKASLKRKGGGADPVSCDR